MIVYKIVPAASWRANEASGVFTGSGVDVRDGFIHFSTAEQVRETAARHFAGVENLLLVAVSADQLEIRWEPSRGGALFPHLYAPLPIASVLWVRELPLVDGAHVFPELLQEREPLAVVARFSALKRSDRLRAIGWVILVSGLFGAAIFYWVRSRSADVELDDLTALGYTKSMQHGMGVMMGPLGGILTDWQHDLTSPLGLALMIAAGTALVAGYFFRVAWVIDADEEGV